MGLRKVIIAFEPAIKGLPLFNNFVKFDTSITFLQ